MDNYNDIPRSKDVTYKDGNTTVKIVAPKISEEERLKNWKDICDTATMIIRNMIERGEV
ncbi:MAG: hypothetical protein N2448_04360 [Caloramator sp.]|nr:hypothetical protein [Caloramator sp.]